MREIPEDIKDAFEIMGDRLSEEMLLSWKSGLCDGLEWTAKACEKIMESLPPICGEREVLTSLALGIRHAEIAVMLDDLNDKAEEDAG
jgi:hypothetical protein